MNVEVRRKAYRDGPHSTSAVDSGTSVKNRLTFGFKRALLTRNGVLYDPADRYGDWMEKNIRHDPGFLTFGDAA